MSFHHEFKKEDPIFSSLFFENIIFQYIIYKLHLIAIKIFSVIQFFIKKHLPRFTLLLLLRPL